MYKLLKSQKNDLFEVIQKKKFNPSDFQWEDITDLALKKISGDKYPTLFYLSGVDYYFQIQYSLESASYKCVYSPGNNRPIENIYVGDWNAALTHFDRWLNNLEDEVSEPDLWNTISQGTELIHAASDSTDDSLFTTEEQKRISISLNEIRQYLLTTFELNKTQQNIINIRIQYLDEASQRLSKKDWKNITLGTLMGLIVDLVIDPARARELFRLAGTALSWLFTHGPAGHILP